ncbi:MAG TPA: hypothetical protein VH914_19570 [Acidimicrobiia bacterium]|jgi:hypothetical protein|nr:hypothetical protein [Acidimicrobiia bacterium]
MTQTWEDHKPRKGRSPSYPGINLETAISRAQKLYAEEGRNAAPMGAITGHWGYTSPKTGPAAVTYAALKKFGLLGENGRGDERMGKLTDLALDIILNPDQSAQARAIRSAALTPPIHTELWEKHKEHGLPSDDSLRYELVRNRGFTESGAAEFIREFRDTVSFAQLTQAATVGPEIPPSTPRLPEQKPPLMPPATPTVGRSLLLPLPGGGSATIETTRPVTEAEWTMLETVLSTMKASFIGTPDAAPVDVVDRGALDPDDEDE